MKTNYHTHTTRCHHATGSDEDYVLSAIKGGYQELGFSDHTPWKYRTGYLSGIRMTPRRISRIRTKYPHITRKVQRPYQHKIRIGV